MENPYEILQAHLQRIEEKQDFIINNIVRFKKMEKEVMTVDDLSEYLKMKRGTIYNLASQKLIPHFKKGKKLLFNTDEIQEWDSKGRPNWGYKMLEIEVDKDLSKKRK